MLTCTLPSNCMYRHTTHTQTHTHTRTKHSPVLAHGCVICDAGAACRYIVQMVRFPHTYNAQTVHINKDTPLGDGSWPQDSRRMGGPSINRLNGMLKCTLPSNCMYRHTTHTQTHTHTRKKHSPVLAHGCVICDAGAARRQVVQMVRFPHTYDTQTVYIRKESPLGDGSWLRCSRRRGRPSINRSNGTLKCTTCLHMYTKF